MSASGDDGVSGVPVFSRNGSLWNMNTYLGRYRHFIDFIDPRYLLRNEDQMFSARDLLKAYDEGDRSATDVELWNAQRLVQCSFGADGSIIPMPFRMCGFIPFNSVVCVGMILPLGPIGQGFFQWANQTHNAAINHFNRPSAEPSPVNEMAVPYALAVGSALSIVFGARALISRSKFSASVKATMNKLVPFGAVCVANIGNISFMRSKELQTGIPVVDSQGNVAGISKEAAKQAIALTAITRCSLSITLLALPPFLIPVIQDLPFMKKYPRLDLPMQLVVLTILFYLGLPNMLAMFPQNMEISRERLEPRFQSYDPEERLYFNKGL